MKTNELYLKTLFCCCACDGEIAQEEVDMIKELTENSTLFQEIQVEYSIKMSMSIRLIVKEKPF